MEDLVESIRWRKFQRSFNVRLRFLVEVLDLLRDGLHGLLLLHALQRRQPFQAPDGALTARGVRPPIGLPVPVVSVLERISLTESFTSIALAELALAFAFASFASALGVALVRALAGVPPIVTSSRRC